MIRENIFGPDIGQYVYAYVPGTGLFEIQIAEEFMIYTFTNDSCIRDMRNDKQDTSLIVDLWDNDYYSRVKKHILGKGYVDVVHEAITLYQKYHQHVPHELMMILQSIKSRKIY